MVLVWYISSHGFGHAARDIEVLNEIGGRRPDVRLVVRTSVPRSFFDASLRVPIELQVADTDTGLAQIDSLRIDEDETARRAAAFYANFAARVDAEAAILRGEGASLVVADIPPLALAAAARAGIPSIALANFTWDWIYRAYPQFDRLAPGIVGTLSAAYADATRALRLPLHGGFETVRKVEDIGFIARMSRRGRDEARRAIGVSAAEPVVLASFGGHNLGLNYDAIARANPFRVIVTDHEYPHPAAAKTLIRLTVPELGQRGLHYADLIAAADAVVGKPGYGIVSECIANRTAFLYTLRSRFAEQEVFVRQMPALLRCREISRDDLVAGRWQAPVDALLAQPAPQIQSATDGASMAAAAILGRFDPTDHGILGGAPANLNDPETR
jgi:hypothetical protein